MSGRLFLPLLFGLLSLDVPAYAQQDRPVAVARNDRHALLVGVTFYENLPAAKHLAGPANDVQLVRKMLIEKFQFSPQHIAVLTEQEGKERGKDFLPTRSSIEREFKRLAQVAQAGDQIVIHMGGHGSQQPEDK